MGPGEHLLYVIQNNITLIVAILVLLTMASAWLVFEAFRSNRNRQEVFQLRRKLGRLEMERASVVAEFNDPVVLSRRWIRTGAAATSTDGGCFIFVDRISPDVRSAELTIRIDGDAVLQNHPVQVGERLEASGKYGTYILRLFAADAVQANLAIALRSRHQSAEQLP